MEETMVNWQPLLSGSVDGLGLAVGGACVGDPLGALPVKDITEVRPHSDEPRGSMTRESPLEEVRKQGGSVYAGPVTYVVANGRIRHIWVRGDLLSTLPFQAEADIERVLGPSKGLERKLGRLVHHYPERNLSVGWHAREGRLEHVTLGPVEWVPLTFGAKEVLREWLDAAGAGLAPEWQEPADRATSQWVRHARVVALLRAFELGSPKDFAEGSFLAKKELSAYPRATQALREAPEDARGFGNTDGLSRLFWWLLIYRTDAERLLRINSGWLSASHAGILAALRMTTDANEGVEAALEDLEAVLMELIEPSGKQLTERELIERWGWPQEDLEQLLMDEL
jgi:hypothetical protein